MGYPVDLDSHLLPQQRVEKIRQQQAGLLKIIGRPETTDNILLHRGAPCSSSNKIYSLEWYTGTSSGSSLSSTETVSNH